MPMSGDIKEVNIPGAHAQIFAQTRWLDDSNSETNQLPILVLIHGYPQSNYLYRYVLELLPKTLPLYIPDIPGYGKSSISADSVKPSYSKRELGAWILEGLKHLLSTTTIQRQKIILLGHDRGARIAHRLAMDNNHPHFEILGAALLDIVPTVIQFQSLGNPYDAAGTFHWAFLASAPPLPEKMIAAFGGDRWVEEKITGWAGKEGAGLKRVKEGIQVYKKHFLSQSVIDATCADYRGAVHSDYQEQIDDQQSGRKLALPTLVIYSKQYLGSRYDVDKVWLDWVQDAKLLRSRAIGNDIGHFLPEEDPQTVTELVVSWLREDLKLAI